MIEKGCGSIINVSSIGAFLPSPKNTVYFGTKSFLKTFSESLHMELIDKGIKVQALCPGFTRSNFLKKLNMQPYELKKLESFKWMAADAVVDYSLKCLRTNRIVCIPGLWYKIIVKLPLLVPKRLYYRLLRKII